MIMKLLTCSNQKKLTNSKTFKMNKFLFILFLFNFSFNIHAQLVDPIKLHHEISELNDRYKYEESIVKLENILNNKKASQQDLYNAHLQKALTYKRLYNYPEVLENLGYAMEEAKNTDFEEAAEVRILTEKMFVEFDSRSYAQAEKLINILATKNLNLLDPETHAFYLSAVAVTQIINKEYTLAKATLDDAIKILKVESPKHLPLIYTKMIGLAEHLKDKDMAQKAFDEGIAYANKYNMAIYKISMYYTMSHFFLTLEDYKNAYLYENQGVEISSQYNATFQSGKLAVLEKNLINKRNNLERDYQKKLQYFLAFSIVILSAFIIVLIKLHKSNKQKNKLIQRENTRMRGELERLTKALDEKGEQKISLDNYNLSQRQLDIIELVKKGKTNKEIGLQLHISENTVKYHLKIIYNILEIDNRSELQPAI